MSGKVIIDEAYEESGGEGGGLQEGDHVPVTEVLDDKPSYTNDMLDNDACKSYLTFECEL